MSRGERVRVSRRVVQVVLVVVDYATVESSAWSSSIGRTDRVNRRGVAYVIISEYTYLRESGRGRVERGREGVGAARVVIRGLLVVAAGAQRVQVDLG